MDMGGPEGAVYSWQVLEKNACMSACYAYIILYACSCWRMGIMMHGHMIVQGRAKPDELFRVLPAVCMNFFYLILCHFQLIVHVLVSAEPTFNVQLGSFLLFLLQGELSHQSCTVATNNHHLLDECIPSSSCDILPLLHYVLSYFVGAIFFFSPHSLRSLFSASTAVSFFQASLPASCRKIVLMCAHAYMVQNIAIIFAPCMAVTRELLWKIISCMKGLPWTNPPYVLFHHGFPWLGLIFWFGWFFWSRLAIAQVTDILGRGHLWNFFRLLVTPMRALQSYLAVSLVTHPASDALGDLVSGPGNAMA